MPCGAFSMTTIATSAEDHQVDRAEVGKRLAEQEEDDRSDDRPLDGADAADHRDEDDIGGPVVDAEGGVGGDAELLQEDERADHGGGAADGDIDEELGSPDADAEALGGDLAVADGGERHAAAGAEDAIGEREDRTASASAAQ